MNSSIENLTEQEKLKRVEESEKQFIKEMEAIREKISSMEKDGQSEKVIAYYRGMVEAYQKILEKYRILSKY